MATKPRTTGLTYEDLQAFPEDNLRRELIDGELIVTAAPSRRHQHAVTELVARLWAYARKHGGEVYPAPFDVLLSETNVVEPDVLFVRSEDLERVEDRFVRGAPNVVFEVSSPSTRALEVDRKRELYERFEIPEFVYVDLDADRVEVYRLEGGRYGLPSLLGRGETLASPNLPGFAVAVEDVLGPHPA